MVLALTMLTNFITEFLYQRFVVFRKSIDTNIKKPESEEQAPLEVEEVAVSKTTEEENQD